VLYLRTLKIKTKKNTTMKYKYFQYFTYLFLFLSFSMIAQNKQEREQITKDYDVSKLNNLKEKHSEEFYKQKNKALLLAAQKGWKLKFTDPKGSHHELMGVTKEGNPIYYKTLNVNAGISTRANFLHNNGGLGLNIEGQGMTAYVWDQGLSRETHQEYDGAGGENRFSAGDGTNALSAHGAHVMGTIISSGFVTNAKGMAPKAYGIGNDWNNDLAEATAAAANGMLVSNHSYTRAPDPIPDWYYGAYIEASRDWDNLMYNTPYYLQVTAAGNDGTDDLSNTDPLEGNTAFDKLYGMQASKNGLAVANGQDATINADGTLNSVLRNTGSSEGPTDDLRVKPDIMGNGTGLNSSIDSADNAYGTFTGTSMAAPNVTGTLLLLQQYYNEKYGAFMKAATLKGLALHTADDTAAIGPDAETGWGLMNAKKAGETITKKEGQLSIISEIELTEGGTYTLVVQSNGVEPLLASISWTDPAGVISTEIVNDATPALVNDIDIRVTKDAETFMPWKLTSVNTNEKEDNTVDPYERVDVENASGEYTITITHKGSLEGGSQNVSLIVTGVSSAISLFTIENAKTACGNTEFFDFNYLQTIGGTTTFSIDGQPTNATVNLSETSLTEDGTFTVTFENLENVAFGTYPISVTGTNGSETTTIHLQLKVLHAFSGEEVVRLSPENGLTGTTTAKIDFSWESYNNAETYLIEVSENPSFNTILFFENNDDLEFSIEGLQSETIYYWRIKPENECVSGDFSSIYSFQTGISDCSNTYEATDFSMASIAITAEVTGYVPFNVTDNIIVDKILVTTDITHTYVQDMLISLEAPESIEGTTVVLLENPCNGTDDINTTFDDSAEDLVCRAFAPAILGSIAPINNMSSPFSGKDAFGEWKLIVYDAHNNDGGQINTASITFCTIETNSNIPSLTHSDIIVNRNSTYTITSADIEATTSSETSSEQIFTLITLPENGNLEKNGTVLSVGDQFNQNELTSGLITYSNAIRASFTDEFKVDVINAANGWLPNNTIIIREATLSLDDTTLEGVSFWPNPAKNRFNIKMINSDSAKITISLFDLQGRKIIQIFEESKKNIFTKEINLENISSGIYLVSIQQGNKKAIKKIIISK
jgi:subtilisin-like proprotein convertase family protein